VSVIARPDVLPGGRGARHRLLRWFALLVVVAVVAVLGTEVVQYRRQLGSLLTHWKGSPTHTDAYVPFPADDLPELRIAVAGDVGDSGSRLTETGAAIAKLAGSDPFDLLLLLGDNVYPSGDPARLPKTVLAPFAGVLDRGTHLLAILGNHDKPNGDAQLAALGMPGHWWSVVRGDVQIIGLDSNQPDNPDQLAWLQETLVASTATWKIVALHHPPYSAGYQGSDKKVRHAFVPLFERYGVQLVLSGHDHDYQRSKPINGVTYVVSGAAAGTRRTGTAASPRCRSPGTATSSSASIRTGWSVGRSTRTTASVTSGSYGPECSQPGQADASSLPVRLTQTSSRNDAISAVRRVGRSRSSNGDRARTSLASPSCCTKATASLNGWIRSAR
jgi:Icc-related predicted phosphoesterase